MRQAIAASLMMVAALVAVGYAIDFGEQMFLVSGVLAWGAVVMSGRLVANATPLRDRLVVGGICWRRGRIGRGRGGACARGAGMTCAGFRCGRGVRSVGGRGDVA